MSKLNKSTNQYIESIIEEQREGYYSDLQPFKAYKNQIFDTLSQVAGSYQEMVKAGYRTLLEELKEERELDDFLITMERKHLSIDVLREMYTVAIKVFREKRYEEARNILTFLLFQNPYIETFWIALGRVFEAEEDKSTALESYKMAIFADPDSAQGYENAIRCCIDLENWGDAEAVLTAGIEVLEEAPDKEETLPLQNRLKELKTLIEQKQGA